MSDMRIRRHLTAGPLSLRRAPVRSRLHAKECWNIFGETSPAISRCYRWSLSPTRAHFIARPGDQVPLIYDPRVECRAKVHEGALGSAKDSTRSWGDHPAAAVHRASPRSLRLAEIHF